MVPAEAVPPFRFWNWYVWFLKICRVLLFFGQMLLWKYNMNFGDILAKPISSQHFCCFAFPLIHLALKSCSGNDLDYTDFFLQLLFSQLTQFIFYWMCWCLLYAKRPQWGRYAQRVLAKPLGLTVYLVFLLHPVTLAYVRFQAESSGYPERCSCYFWICLADSRGTELSLHMLKDFQSSQDNSCKVLNVVSVQNKSHRVHSWVFRRTSLKHARLNISTLSTWLQNQTKPLSILTAVISATHETKGVILCTYHTSHASLRFPNIQTQSIPGQLLLT